MSHHQLPIGDLAHTALQTVASHVDVVMAGIKKILDGDTVELDDGRVIRMTGVGTSYSEDYVHLEHERADVPINTIMSASRDKPAVERYSTT